MTTRIGQLQVSYSARRIPSYHIEMWHEELKKHRFIRGPDADVVRRKAQLQEEEWDQRWAQVEERDSARQTRESQRQTAMDRTEEAERDLAGLAGLLKQALSHGAAIEWESLKNKSTFSVFQPQKQADPEAPPRPAAKREPQASDPGYKPKLGLLGLLSSSIRDRRTEEARQLFHSDHQRWEKERADAEALFASATEAFRAAVRAKQAKHEQDLRAWEEARVKFERKKAGDWAAVDRQETAYLTMQPDAVLEYCDMVLSSSEYPDYFSKEFDLDYRPDVKMLLVEYSLPSPDALPTVKEVKYVQSRDEFVEHHLSESQAAKLYDDVVYQTILRTVHELFDADLVGAIDMINFNGWVRSIDRSTGKEVNACIVSLQASKPDFGAINLDNVDPRACFKSLKGIGSSKLHGLAAVAPIMQIRREDGRFITAREIADTLDESVNLAAMDWEDFEHLIREIFEKEFTVAGGEVKVTQASRDGGVDAVAFDPDPIRGGKIVIQAKRYTNTVGVSAVRDLYGTVMNEGANKGILVTTSDYGPDAYEFVKGKPLTLMNGANLLYLLEKHGHKGRIDIQEARLIVASQPAKPSAD